MWFAGPLMLAPSNIFFVASVVRSRSMNILVAHLPDSRARVSRGSELSRDNLGGNPYEYANTVKPRRRRSSQHAGTFGSQCRRNRFDGAHDELFGRTRHLHRSRS